jgi:flagellar P-ring protein precursor FlgI
MRRTLPRTFTAAALALLVAATSVAPEAHAIRIKDAGPFDGVRKNQLIGYGLVVGLDGTGDTDRASFTPQSLEAMLSRLGVRIDKKKLSLRNIAAVTVTADLPAFVKPGTTIDVQVSSIGDARSLVGGTLLMTPLIGGNGETYAVAQGPLSVGSETERNDYTRLFRGRLNAGRIPAGGLVEREVPVLLGQNGVLQFTLGRPDFRSAANVADAINRNLPRLLPDLAAAPPAAGPVVAVGGVAAPVAPGAAPPIFARPVDPGRVEITIPPGWMDRVAGFIAVLEGIDAQTDAIARVVVSGSTGAVVLGGDVRLSRVAIAYEGISVAIRDPEEAAARRRPTDTLKVVDGGATLAEVVRGLNSLGVGARELIDILTSLSAAGALHAQLEVVP